MTAPRCTASDYIDFLLATPRVVSATEAARVQPDRPHKPAHDAFTRLLHRLEPDPQELWREVGPLVPRRGGLLILDDSVLDKPYARHMGLVGRFWSGKHKRIVKGIDLVTLLWIDGDGLWPSIYHRGLKQHCGVERAQVRHPDAQRNHIGCALRAFVRLEYHRFSTGVSWFEAKLQVIREAVKVFLARPLYRLPVTTTA